MAEIAGIPACNVVVWIDNIAVHGPRVDCERWYGQLVQVLADFNITIREEGRGQQVDFIGVHWDLAAHTAAFLPRWRAKARDLVAAVSDRPLTPLVLQRVVGMCVWAHTLKGEPLVFFSNLLAHLAYVSRAGQGKPGPVLRLPADALADIHATLEGLDHAFPLATEELPRHPQDLWTDSCTEGAAFVWAFPDFRLDPPVSRVWRWDEDSQATHINLKELRSLHVALLAADSALRDASIRWACDNQVCCNIVANLHSRSPPLAKILREIVHLCRERNLHVEPVWVPTAVQLADGPSRATAGAPRIAVLTP